MSGLRWKKWCVFVQPINIFPNTVNKKTIRLKVSGNNYEMYRYYEEPVSSNKDFPTPCHEAAGKSFARPVLQLHLQLSFPVMTMLLLWCCHLLVDHYFFSTFINSSHLLLYCRDLCSTFLCCCLSQWRKTQSSQVLLWTSTSTESTASSCFWTTSSLPSQSVCYMSSTRPFTALSMSSSPPYTSPLIQRTM